VLRFELQPDLVAGGVADQRFLDLGQQVVAAEIELDRLGQFVDGPVLRIIEFPRQRDDTGGGDLHAGMMAQAAPAGACARMPPWT